MTGTHIGTDRAAIPGAGLALVAALAILAGGCTKKDDRVLFDGLYFKSKASAIDKKKTLAEFTVTVNDVSQSLDAARSAGGYEGTRYCVQNFGSSKIDWTVGPETEPQFLTIDKDTLTFQGTCLRP